MLHSSLFTCVPGLRGFQQLTGYTAIIFYAETVFEESGSFINASTATIIFFAIQLGLCILTSFVVDFSGRKPLLLVSLAGTAIALLANGIFLYLKNNTDMNLEGYAFISFLALVSYIVVFSIGMQTIPVLLISEVFASNVKASAMCLMDIYYSGIAAVISLYFHWTKDSFGMDVSFFTFAIFSASGIIFVVFVVPETKGKSLEEIQEDFRAENILAVPSKCLKGVELS